MKDIKLRDESIPEIDMMDIASASLSDKFLTLSKLYKVGERESFDMVMLELKEARELLNFLKENL